MIYDEFVNEISKIDNTNIFNKSSVTDNSYNDFYNFYNPCGVEFEFNSSVVFMIPYEKIAEITEEYNYLKSDYVFAICNSDPFFVKDKKVYTCCHGTNNPKLELIANSFEEFLKFVLRGVNK